MKHMNTLLVIFFSALALILLIVDLTERQQRSPLPWVYAQCWNVACVTTLLNDQDARDVVVMGAVTIGQYDVWYRRVPSHGKAERP